MPKITAGTPDSGHKWKNGDFLLYFSKNSGCFCSSFFKNLQQMRSSTTLPTSMTWLSAWLAGALVAQGFTVDGIRNTTDEGTYTQRTVQLNQGAQNNVMANLYTAVTDANLRVFLGGRADLGNAILLFIDSKPGGVPVDATGPYIPSDLIASGDLPGAINNLGLSPTSGMRFESGFQPDYAIRIGGDGNQALVHYYDLAAGTGHALSGDAGTGFGGALRSGGFISGARVWWQDVFGLYAQVDRGVELSLNLPLMGASAGTHTIRMMGILVNGDSTSATNQTLGPLDPPVNPPRAAIGSAINTFDFGTEPGEQTVAFEVIHAVTDSDGDGLFDEHETNDGIYLSATATGSDPLVADTDGDGQSDGNEVAGTLFGYLTNPNIPNYADIWAPANFTTPAFTPNASTLMVRAGDDITGQYQWSKLYRIQNTGSVNFKITAGGSPEINWGPGSAPGTVLPGSSNNFTGSAPATGFYQIDFDQAALTWSFGRKVFPTLQEYLDAYNVPAAGDNDGDSISNEDEYDNNTDPTKADSDGDGLNDAADPNPLLALRDIVFSVDMNVQITQGNFDPGSEQVRVQFFDGVAAPGELALTSAGGGIYTGTLSAVAGSAGLQFGAYKFAIVPIGGGVPFFEDQFRNFDLGPAHQAQALPVVFFNNNEGSGSANYELWAEQFIEYPGPPSQDFDKDGFSNYEEFLYGTWPDQPTGKLVEMTISGGEVVIRYNERDDFSVLLDVQVSPDLSEGSWTNPETIDFNESFDQTGLPEGYIRQEARVPMTGERLFFRMAAQEEAGF
jgi:hypothetical protein